VGWLKSDWDWYRLYDANPPYFFSDVGRVIVLAEYALFNPAKHPATGRVIVLVEFALPP
jgi:hypothetical protein